MQRREEQKVYRLQQDTAPYSQGVAMIYLIHFMRMTSAAAPNVCYVHGRHVSHIMHLARPSLCPLRAPNSKTKRRRSVIMVCPFPKAGVTGAANF